MNKEIKICYIDDRPDLGLSDYLVNKVEENDRDYEIKYCEYIFEQNDDYRSLMKYIVQENVNLIIIDSRLFENVSVSYDKFTGEKFRVIMTHINPYIKTIVISQNELQENTTILSKYKSIHGAKIDEDKYYDIKLFPTIQDNINLIIEERHIVNSLVSDVSIDKLLTETIEKSISGMSTYSEFEKKELDELINLFREIKQKYENK